MVKINWDPRHSSERARPRAGHRRRAIAVTSILSLGLIVTLSSAIASPRDAESAGTESRSAAPTEVPDGADVTGLEQRDGTITITEPGTVIDAMFIRGAINVRADNVTIKNTLVAYAGYHSIRIFPDVDGTRIIDTDVYCLRERANGIVFGNYYAENVALHGCRNDFMFSDRNPAEIVNSTVDGEIFEADGDRDGQGPLPSSEPERTTSPDPEPSPETSSSPNPNPSPEQSPEPSSSPHPEPSSSPKEDPEPSGFPDASTTGVPHDVDLTGSGSLTITEDGTVVDGLHVRGTITIAADDVTIRNTLIQGGGSLYPIRVEGGTTGTLIEHVEVDNLGDTGIGILLSGSGTVRYVDIHSAEDGIRIQSDDVTLEYSYIHDLQRQPGGHHDTVQIRSGDNVTLRGNNLQPYVASTDDPMNAALQIGSLAGSDRISNLLVTGNLMNGGNFTINGGGRNEVDSARYSDNQFGREFRYAPIGNLQHSVFESSNVWFDTGEPVR